MTDNESWDVIVVGSGATGGVAAMTLSEGGCRVLVIEAGRNLTPEQTFPGDLTNTIGRLRGISSGRHQRQAQHPGYWKNNPELYVDERLHPYDHPDDQPFLWTQGQQVGGRSLTWGGITLRLSDEDFEGVSLDGTTQRWPIGSAELTPHYDALEQFLGVHGAQDQLPHLPDGASANPLPFTAAEQRFADQVEQRLGHRVIHARGFAPHRQEEGPWPRSSSRGSSLQHALHSGRVQVLSDHKVERLLMATHGEHADGVVAVDQSNGSRKELKASHVVLCGSTIQSIAVLLRSRQQGLHEPSGQLGQRLMDHVSTAQFFAMPGPSDTPQPALSGAGSFFLPFGRRLQDPDFSGGYGLWGGIGRFDPPEWLRRTSNSTTGFLIGHGEVMPDPSNRVSLSRRCDRWGIAIPHIACRWRANEQAMVRHMRRTMLACIEAAGAQAMPIKDLFRLPLVEPMLEGAVALSESAPPPGYYIHEVGGAPMGVSPESSVVDSWNRLWRCPNVLVVDGACWPTSAWQSPTLTMMAITRRACQALVSPQGE
ncbi:MAG: GMC oxidoreductase [Synechococcus sp.]